MALQTTYWLFILTGLTISMFVIIPPKLLLELSYIGFLFGFVQALTLIGLGQVYFRFFLLVGDPTVFGVPLISSLSWIPAVIIYAYYFKTADTLIKKIALLALTGAGAVAAQYILTIAGMWESLNWNLFYTFLLAIFAHTLISTYLFIQYRKKLSNS